MLYNFGVEVGEDVARNLFAVRASTTTTSIWRATTYNLINQVGTNNLTIRSTMSDDGQPAKSSKKIAKTGAPDGEKPKKKVPPVIEKKPREQASENGGGDDNVDGATDDKPKKRYPTTMTTPKKKEPPAKHKSGTAETGPAETTTEAAVVSPKKSHPSKKKETPTKHKPNTESNTTNTETHSISPKMKHPPMKKASPGKHKPTKLVETEPPLASQAAGSRAPVISELSTKDPERWKRLQDDFLVYSNFRLLPNDTVHKNDIVTSFRQHFEKTYGTEEQLETRSIEALLDDWYDRKVRKNVINGVYEGIHLNPKYLSGYKEAMVKQDGTKSSSKKNDKASDDDVKNAHKSPKKVDKKSDEKTHEENDINSNKENKKRQDRKDDTKKASVGVEGDDDGSDDGSKKKKVKDKPKVKSSSDKDGSDTKQDDGKKSEKKKSSKKTKTDVDSLSKTDKNNNTEDADDKSKKKEKKEKKSKKSSKQKNDDDDDNLSTSESSKNDEAKKPKSSKRKEKKSPKRDGDDSAEMKFLGDFEWLEGLNEAGELNPETIFGSPKTKKKLIVLHSTSPGTLKQRTNQDRAMTILRGRSILNGEEQNVDGSKKKEKKKEGKTGGNMVELVDASDPEKKELRDKLFELSQANGKSYPQFFLEL